MKCVILAAGEGSRMRPLTKEKPKPMIKIGGEPFLEKILNRVGKFFEEENIGVVVGYKKERIIEFLKGKYPDIIIIEDKYIGGTGLAVKQCEEFVSGEDFLVLMGDNLYSKEDMEKLVGREKKCIGAKRVSNPEQYGVLKTNKEKLEEIIEKLEEPPTNLINTGIYKLSSKIFELLEEVEESERGEIELTDAVNLLAKRKEVKIMKLENYWLDITRPNDLKRVEEELRKI